MTETITVILADDHPALRFGLRVLLDRHPNIDVLTEVEQGDQVLPLVNELSPTVLILDCQLPEVDGMTVAQHLHRQQHPVKIIALSAYDEARYLAAMKSAGASGYLLKSKAPAEIVDAVIAVTAGQSLWTPEQLHRIKRWQDEVQSVIASLTEREMEVLPLLADGLSNKEIAQQLVVTVRTTDFHVSNILRKLSVASRVEAAMWMREHLGDSDQHSLD